MELGSEPFDLGSEPIGARLWANRTWLQAYGARLRESWPMSRVMKAAAMMKAASMTSRIVKRLKQVTIYIRSITL
jgi:hypothetical protein